MDVNELRQLSEWYIEHYSELISRYSGVLSPLQHNASQPNKQPVESQLELLLVYLRDMKFDELSLQQLRLLSSLGVENYIGVPGANFVNSAIRTSNFDPATAVGKINEALNKLREVHSSFSSYAASVKALGLNQLDEGKQSSSITIRVGFQKGAAIDNVTDWKESAKDWYDIIRGLALASNEPPEATKVVDASTGSIILILTSTLTVTTLLALISKNIASVTKDVIGIVNQVEDLRHKKLLSSVIEKDLRKQEHEIKDRSLKDIVDLIRQKIPDLDGEKVTGLEGSIKKLLSFNEKGGNVDFVAPEVAEGGLTDDVENSDETQKALVGARAAIHEYQSEREQIKLLTDKTNNG